MHQIKKFDDSIYDENHVGLVTKTEMESTLRHNYNDYEICHDTVTAQLNVCDYNHEDH